jgi:CheY-like chemotaxis protein
LPTWTGLAKCQALVIDGNPASRTALVSMLREFGVGTIVQTTRAQDARRMLEHRHFDIVVCEYHFENQPMNGQDLMDDLRLAQLLPLSTVVVMISSEAGYANVSRRCVRASCSRSSARRRCATSSSAWSAAPSARRPSCASSAPKCRRRTG